MKKWKKPVIKNNSLTKWKWLVQNCRYLKLGKNVDIGAFTYINARYGVEILDNVQIGSHCSLYSYSTIDNTRGKIIIKTGAKIGTHSTIMPGVVIGKNALIGAYSFVKIKVPDNAIAYGVPAKIIKLHK